MRTFPTCARRIDAILLISSALAATLPTGFASAQNSLRPRMAAAACQPLTRDNFEMCCIALNRRSILSSEQLAQCPPLTTSVISAVLAGSENDGNDGGTGSDGGSGGTDDGSNGGNGGGGSGGSGD